jgi:hypothetical protein
MSILCPNNGFNGMTANVDVFAKQGAFVFISLVVMPFNILIAFLTVIFLEQYHPT